MNRDVNILVLDTEVYSNTGGQASKATPIGAAAKFAMAGKSQGKKDLAMLAMTYGHPYVARVAMGAKDAQAVTAMREADSYGGTSVVLAYAHCIAHGYELSEALDQQARAVDSGYWPLFRYDPRRIANGESPLKMDSAAPKSLVAEFVARENRFRQVQQSNPEQFKSYLAQAEKSAKDRYALYEHLSRAMAPAPASPAAGEPKARA
jgi:pyruvate-ferredoxin/flavodoxin oxidoreductase